MSDYRPEIGHRVRGTETYPDGTVVTAEGIVKYISSSSYGLPFGDRMWLPGYEAEGVVATVERLLDPEPTWQTGDIVLCAAGDIHTRIPEMSQGTVTYVWALGGLPLDAALNSDWEQDGRLPRPLTPLVRDDRPWPVQP